MREKLNDNPLVQVAVLGVLILGTGFFLLSTMGGGGKEETDKTTTSLTATTPTGEVSVTATGTAPLAGEVATPPPAGALAAAAPPPPRSVSAAFDAGNTVALLFVRNSGIDDRLVKQALGALEALPDVSTFVVPADRIARYAAITQGVEVNRVPALVVVRPKRLGKQVPTAAVLYGFQSSESMVQAVVDAEYKGRTLGYHP
jgi:hypothetical protein